MAAYVSVKSGNWNDPLTWGSASYPSIDGDTFTISIGHEVIYNVNSIIQYGNSGVWGTLKISQGMNTRMVFQAAKALAIYQGGKFYCGTSELDYLSKDYTFILEWATLLPNGGVACNATGDFRLFGDPAFQTIRKTKLAVNWTTGSVFTVIGDVSTAWRIGDELIIGRHVAAVIASSQLNTIYRGTIKSMTLSGSNTLVEINEANPGWTCYADGRIVNLNSHNIIFRKVAYGSAVGDYTIDSPYFLRTGGVGANYLTTPTYFNNVTFHSIYRVGVDYNVQMKRCLWRNTGYYLLYGSNAFSLDDCIFAICTRPLSASRSVYVNNCVYVGGSGAFSDGSYNITIENSEFYSSSVGIATNINLTVKNCKIFNCNYALAYLNGALLYDVIMYNGCGLMGMMTNNKFIRCYWSYDENGVVKINGIDLYYDYGFGGTSFQDCKIRWSNGSDEPSTDGRRNMSWQKKNGPLYSGNHNQILGDNRAYHQFGTIYSEAIIKKSASISLKAIALSACGNNDYVPDLGPCIVGVINWTENNVPASIQNRRVYVQGTGWGAFPTLTQLYLEAEYYDTALGWTTTKKYSSEVLSANGAWTALTVQFTPGRIGPVTYRVVLATYQAGALIYLDHALYYSATEFLEAGFDWGKSVLPMAPPPTFPAATNVRALTAYGTPLVPLTGVMDQALEVDVEKNVIYDNGTKTGRFWKPTEAQTLLGVGFGADGTEFVGELALEIPGAVFDLAEPAISFEIVDLLPITMEVG